MEVRRTAWQAAGSIDCNTSAGAPYHSDQLPLAGLFAACDAGPHRLCTALHVWHSPSPSVPPQGARPP